MSKSRRGNYQVSFEKIHKKSAPGPSSQARAAPCSVTQEVIQHNSAACMKMSSEVDALLPSVHPAGEHILAQSGGEVCVETEIKIKTTESNFLLPLSLLVCERRLSILFLVTTYNTSVLESNVAWSMDKFEPFRRLLNVLYCISYVACNCQILSLVLVLPKSERLNCIGKPIPGAQCS